MWVDAPALPVLDEGGVDVWAALLEQPQDRIRVFSDTLAEDELARAARFASARLVSSYVVSRGILRDILSRYCGADPKSVSFEYSPRGKPALAPVLGRSGVRFNMSHSGGVFMCAVGRGFDVGIDVEQIAPRDAFLRLAARFFARGESEGIRNLPPEQQLEAFYACWTRKEAYVKGKGSGLFLPLDKFEVSFRPDEVNALLYSGIDKEDVARWSLFDVSPQPGYSGALAAEYRDPAVRLLQWRFA